MNAVSADIDGNSAEMNDGSANVDGISVCYCPRPEIRDTLLFALC